jgi:hypothetical protein
MFTSVPTTTFARNELEVLAAEGMTVPRAEVGEPADAGVHLVHLAGETVGRKPLHHRVGIQERAVNAVGRSTEHSVKTNGVGC